MFNTKKIITAFAIALMATVGAAAPARGRGSIASYLLDSVSHRFPNSLS